LDTLGGFRDAKFVYGLKINARQCSIEALASNMNNTSCLEASKLQNEFQNEVSGGNFFYSFKHMEVLPDLEDYYDPIKPNLKNK